MAKKTAQKKPVDNAVKIKRLRDQIARHESQLNLLESGATPEVIKLVKQHTQATLRSEGIAAKLRDLGFATDGTKL